MRDKPELGKAPEGHTLYSATTGKLVFTASNMPAAPCWQGIRTVAAAGSGNGLAPIPAGVFKPDLQGSAAVDLP